MLLSMLFHNYGDENNSCCIYYLVTVYPLKILKFLPNDYICPTNKQNLNENVLNIIVSPNEIKLNYLFLQFENKIQKN